MENEELKQLLYEALETELGGVKVYEMAIQCAVNEDLKTEWQEYLEQTTNHVTVVRDMFEKLGLDPEMETPGPSNRPSYRSVAGEGYGNGQAIG